MAQVVESLERHAAGHGAVPHHGDHAAVRARLLDRGGEPVGVGEAGGCVAVLDPVVLGLAARRVPGQPAGLAEGGEQVAPSGEDLVDVGLVSGVPDDDVARGLEHAVHGQRQLHHAEVGSEMAAGPEDGLHDEAPDLFGQLVQLRVGEAQEVGWALDRLQNHGLPGEGAGRELRVAPRPSGGVALRIVAREYFTEVRTDLRMLLAKLV